MDPSALAPTRSRSQTASTVWTPQQDQLLCRLVNEYDGLPCWSSLVVHFPGKTSQQLAGRWDSVLKPDLIKGSWTREEDLIIQQFVSVHGTGNWVQLATYLPGRIGKQCRERWLNHLNPAVQHEGWTKSEDDALIKLHQQFGNQWTKISSYLPGRTDNCIKNRWNSTLKRRLERLANGEPINKKRGRKPKLQARTVSSDADTGMISSPQSENERRIEFPSLSSLCRFDFGKLPYTATGQPMLGQEHALDVRFLLN
jgi:hypothetical protein